MDFILVAIFSKTKVLLSFWKEFLGTLYGSRALMSNTKWIYILGTGKHQNVTLLLIILNFIRKILLFWFVEKTIKNICFSKEKKWESTFLVWILLILAVFCSDCVMRLKELNLHWTAAQVSLKLSYDDLKRHSFQRKTKNWQ